MKSSSVLRNAEEDSCVLLYRHFAELQMYRKKTSCNQSAAFVSHITTRTTIALLSSTPILAT